jgi:drug/metabolite transporter (DMT)-like permease
MGKMSLGLQGLIWCLVFVVLDAAQAVYFGGILQRLDGFLLGGLVFGISSIGCIVWTVVVRPQQVRVVTDNFPAILGVNLSAAGGWMAYFIAIQVIEPAVAFTIFSGVIPLTTIAASKLGFAEAQSSRNWVEAFGNGVLTLGMALLALFTLLGWSGFVRGGIDVGLLGLIFSVIAGVLIAMMLLYSKRLDLRGLEPVPQFGFRFPIYLVMTAIGYAFGIDAKPPVPLSETLYAIAIGLVVLAFPIYAVQKAVSLTSSLTIGSVAAVAPLIVFGLQVLEGRVDYSNSTSLGLAVYFIGAVIAAMGSAHAATRLRRTA